jgi:glutamate N-acetyltransferase/amino-acid N-acetyltransferase
VTKTSEKRITLNNNKVSITGVAKGSGMINPEMATMLSFVATDIKISKFELNKLLKDITDTTYNMITIDGETSTNDSSIIIATGKSNVDYKSLKKTEKEIFVKNLKELYLSLAQKIVNDGEGATKFIKVNVERVSTKKLAKEIAMSIANSPLFKTAMFAEDPNWGRILCAIGNIESNVNDLSKIEIYIGNNLVFKNNSIYKNYSESKSKKYLKNKNLEINIKYNNGKESAVVWTTDLSYEYVKINAEYRT